MDFLLTDLTYIAEYLAGLPSDKLNLITAKTTGLIFLLFDVALA